MGRDTIEQINDYYERLHLSQQDNIIETIKSFYDEVIKKIAPLIAANAPINAINKKLDKLFIAMVKSTTVTIETGMQKSWESSLKKTSEMVTTAYKGIDLPKPIQEALNDRRTQALKQFVASSRDGLDLSDRVWKTADQFKELINQNIEDGFPEGRSAYKVGKSLRAGLLNPETQDKPGQGVYKSPIKNAERVARTVINSAYRMADQEAWAKNPLVLGYEIKLSATGKPKTRCELCRSLEGSYPVSFVWAGWHPHCLCFKIPILMSRDMLDQYNKLIAKGEDSPENVAKLQKDVRVKNTPGAFDNWVKTNLERVQKWKSSPYWWKDNINLIGQITAESN